MRRTDVQRSVRRWLNFALDDSDWTLRDERAEVPDDQRPAGYVEAAGPVTTVGARVSVPQGDVLKRLTMSAALYPATTGTAEECGIRARELVDLLESSLTVGLVLPAVVGPPEELELPLWPSVMPLWDFTGVADDEAPDRVPVAYADVDSATIRDVPDPLDDKRWTVVFELRLSWWAGGRSRLGTGVDPTVADVIGVVDGVPGGYPDGFDPVPE